MLRKLRRQLSFLHIIESVLATVFFGFPGRKLTVIGVTGTDGKTTTTTLIHHLLTEAGFKTGIMSTLASLHTTTPGRWRVQKFLSQCVKNGCTHAVLEVTSIAVDQYRVAGTVFKIGVLTNIAPNEHLDYHHHFDLYKAAKLKFLLGCKTIVTNADDLATLEILEKAKGKKIITYGLKNAADNMATNIILGKEETNFDLNGQKFEMSLLGEFNVYNALAAISVAELLGISTKTIQSSLKTFLPPSGRMEIVTRAPYTVIVDFAHTAQAFERVLPVARHLLKNKSSRLIHVFGATGDRDKSKRPLMAQISSMYADVIILTHEDTYSEDPAEIISQLESGIDKKTFTDGPNLENTKLKQYFKVADRKEAIKVALELAKPGDVVILTGVGHQKSMNIGGKEVPWSDQKTVLDLIKKK